MFVGYDDGERLVKVSSGRTGNSVFEDTGVIASKKKAKGGSMLAILKSGAYIFSAYTRANLLFIFQVIHLFITDYANNGLKVDDTKILLKYYGSASVFGPTLGALSEVLYQLVLEDMRIKNQSGSALDSEYSP